MVFYLFQSISVLFILISLSSFFNNRLNINNNIKYIFTILIIILSCFLTLKTIKFLNSNLDLNLDYVFIFKIIFFIFLISVLFGVHTGFSIKIDFGLYFISSSKTFK